MNEIIDFLKEFNLQTILSMGVLVWYFTRDIKASIENLDRDLRNMNTRLSRVEGAVFGTDIYDHVEGK